MRRSALVCVDSRMELSGLAREDFLLEIEFDNGEIKIFDVKPYIKGEWYGKLADRVYFKTVVVDGFTVVWPDGQDICPDELYTLSTSLCS